MISALDQLPTCKRLQKCITQFFLLPFSYLLVLTQHFFFVLYSPQNGIVCNMVHVGMTRHIFIFRPITRLGSWWSTLSFILTLDTTNLKKWLEKNSFVSQCFFYLVAQISRRKTTIWCYSCARWWGWLSNLWWVHISLFGHDWSLSLLLESRAICRYLEEKYQGKGITWIANKDAASRGFFERAASIETSYFDSFTSSFVFE